MVVVLHNIRSVHNVGSIFRTSDAVGVLKMHLCGFTPTPLNRVGEIRAQFQKTAIGAEKNVQWEKCRSTWQLIERLKKDGYEILVVEQDRRSIPYYTARAKKKTALVLGDELKGLPESALARADKILEIPMAGAKESLNVSVAFGIVAYSLQYKK